MIHTRLLAHSIIKEHPLLFVFSRARSIGLSTDRPLPAGSVVAGRNSSSNVMDHTTKAIYWRGAFLNFFAKEGIDWKRLLKRYFHLDGRRFKQRDEGMMHDTIWVVYDRAKHALPYLVLAENHFRSRWIRWFVVILIGILSWSFVGFNFVRDTVSLKMNNERLGTTYFVKIDKDDKLEQIDNEMKCGN